MADSFIVRRKYLDAHSYVFMQGGTLHVDTSKNSATAYAPDGFVWKTNGKKSFTEIGSDMGLVFAEVMFRARRGLDPA